ncbi:MAG: formylglycine-generating enzyme family protein [Acidobacteria bacterium]|nr:formylglycine-generating enzyme family protein [Acidobacteriota bacterium]
MGICRALRRSSAETALNDIAWYANNAGRGVIDADSIARADAASYLEKLTANGAQTRPVGTKRPNAFGLYDMSGNVWEWCEDLHNANYVGAPVDGSAILPSGAPNLRSLRGGSWFNFGWVLRPTLRVWREPDFRDHDLGLRIVARVKQ